MNNYCKAAERRLNRDEIAVAIKIYRDAPAGRYTLKQLFADLWLNTMRPRAYGKWFKASAIAGDLPGLRWLGRRTNRSQEYRVLEAGRAMM